LLVTALERRERERIANNTMNKIKPSLSFGFLFLMGNTDAYSCRPLLQSRCDTPKRAGISGKELHRADFLRSVVGTVFFFGVPSAANAAAQDPAASFQTRFDSLNKDAKKLGRDLSKETKKATKEIKKEVKKIDRVVSKETKKVTKETKKVIKKVDKETKKVIKKVDKETKGVQLETKKLGNALEKKATELGVLSSGGNGAASSGGKVPPKKSTGIDTSKMKQCKDPKTKCL
jgi:uncharacterized FlaG/YvyC family protein